MDRFDWHRAATAAAFATLLGAGAGLFASALYGAWVRVLGGETNQQTLLLVLLLLASALACWWGAALARARLSREKELELAGYPRRIIRSVTVQLPRS